MQLQIQICTLNYIQHLKKIHPRFFFFGKNSSSIHFFWEKIQYLALNLSKLKKKVQYFQETYTLKLYSSYFRHLLNAVYQISSANANQMYYCIITPEKLRL